MKDVFARLATDFFSTIVFLVIYLVTGNIVLATGVAIAGAIGQVIYSRIKGNELGFMTWASLGLVIVLGSATIITQDPRFVLAKPAIAHFAIGTIMLKRGWMLRYMPPIVAETIPEYVTLGRADVRARRRHGSDRHDRRSQAVDALRLRRAGQRQGRGVRHPVCGLSRARHQPHPREPGAGRHLVA